MREYPRPPRSPFEALIRQTIDEIDRVLGPGLAYLDWKYIVGAEQSPIGAWVVEIAHERFRDYRVDGVLATWTGETGESALRRCFEHFQRLAPRTAV